MDEPVIPARVDYADVPLDPATLGTDPMGAARAWLADAAAGPLPEPNAMALATSSHGAPSVRMVLLKELDVAAGTFGWYTDLGSRKALEVADGERRAALCWWWPGEPSRQLRACGEVRTVDRARVDAYYRSRPDGARVGAHASMQSRPLADREQLEERVARASAAPPEVLDRAPAHWGGLELVADELEFWHGRSSRLHDRVAYLRCGDAPGTLAPGVGGAACRDEAEVQARFAAGEVVHDAGGRAWLRVRLAP